MLLPNRWWLMLLPSVADGMATCFDKADVISIVADGIATWLECVKADLIALVADGTSHWKVYFNFSSLLLIRTSSHIWGRWYLPMFLFRDGLLTLINIDSIISLERFCSSLPTMLKFSSEVVWTVVLLWAWIGEGAFRCSLNLSPNVLDVSPMYSSSHSNWPHLNL